MENEIWKIEVDMLYDNYYFRHSVLYLCYQIQPCSGHVSGVSVWRVRQANVIFKWYLIGSQLGNRGAVCLQFYTAKLPL